MNPVFILIVIVGILSSIANKKRKEEMKKKAEQQPPYPSQHSPYGQKSAPAKPATASRQTRPASSATSNKPSSRGVDSKWPWPTAEEKVQNKTKAAAANNYGGTPRYTHVVTSTLEGGHTHTESSMTGEESCPPPKPVPQKSAANVPTQAPKTSTLLDFESNSVLQGVLYAQILGKPKALQGK